MTYKFPAEGHIDMHVTVECAVAIFDHYQADMGYGDIQCVVISRWRLPRFIAMLQELHDDIEAGAYDDPTAKA